VPLRARLNENICDFLEFLATENGRRVHHFQSPARKAQSTTPLHPLLHHTSVVLNSCVPGPRFVDVRNKADWTLSFSIQLPVAGVHSL
jgi:hypothetical protein